MPSKNYDRFILVEEFLPFLEHQFKEIVYEVTPKHIPEKGIIDYMIPIAPKLDKILGGELYKYLHVVSTEEDIPEDLNGFKYVV
jgi:hypothetical protein